MDIRICVIIPGKSIVWGDATLDSLPNKVRSLLGQDNVRKLTIEFDSLTLLYVKEE